MDNLNEEIKWRGSVYRMEKVKDGKVHWFNLVSRHRQTCSVDSWKSGDPYDGRYT